MIYRFRIILDTEEDIFRDIEINQEATLEDFHNTITQSFGFEGLEMASFYTTDDEWKPDEEIALFDMEETEEPLRVMAYTLIEDLVDRDQTRLIYVYDFFNMWTFFIELADVVEPQEGISYPNLLHVHGQIPDQAPPTDFSGDEDENDDLDDEEYYGSNFDLDSSDDFDFDENWN